MGRPSLRVAAQPGQTVRGSVRVENLDPRPRTIRPRPSDLVTADTGGPSFPARRPSRVAGYGIATGAGGPYWVQDFASGLGSALATSPAEAPACPREPTSLDAAAPATDAFRAAPVGTTAAAEPPRSVAARPRVRARRTGRRLLVSVLLPSRAGATVTLTLRVRQRGRTVGVRSLRVRPAGTTRRIVLRLRSAGRGHVSVSAGRAPTVTVRFP